MSGGGPVEPVLTRSPDGRLAWTGMLLGAIGLFVLNLVFGPVAIGLGVTALRHGVSQHGVSRVSRHGVSQQGVSRRSVSRHRGSACGAAVIAITLGVADVAVLAALALGSVAHGGIVWHFGA